MLVGIDSVNIDATPPRGDRPVHTLLLEREIPVVEHLTGLDQLPATGATFTAVPVKVAGLSTFPVRAFAVPSDVSPSGKPSTQRSLGQRAARCRPRCRG